MDLNRKNMKKIMLLIAFTVVLYLGLSNMDIVFSKISLFIGLIWPFVLGAVIAFIINVPMSFFEKKIFCNKEITTKKRTVSVVFTLLLITLITTLISVLIVPELFSTVSKFIVKLPAALKEFSRYITHLSNEYPILARVLDKVQFDFDMISDALFKFFKTTFGSILSSGFVVAHSIVSGVTNTLIAFIFALYILFQKETLVRQARMIGIAVLPEKKYTKIEEICSLSYRIFSNFLSGQFLEAVIISSIFLVVLSAFKFPYAILISLIIAVTALIPIIGAFIGCIFGAFLILVDDPKKALIFIIVFLVIQQIEGNLIYPRVVGNSIGLPAIWVLVAVIFGGAVMGIAGVIIFIPLFSILYTLLREAIYNIIRTKNIPKSRWDIKKH